MNRVILGDPSILIQEMIKNNKLKNASLGHIINMINHQIKYLGQIDFFHILKDNNKITDIQPSKAMAQDLGEA